MMNANFIPCAKWVKRGVAKSHPEVIQFSKEELKELLLKAKTDVLETAEELQSISGGNDESESNVGDDFNMEDYDREDDVQSLIGIGNLISATEFPENSDNNEEDDDEDDSEKEDDEIKPTDNLLAVGHVFGDISVLEVYVFNEEDNDLYVHHDIVLPTVPLSMEWLSYSSSSSSRTDPGNLLALGSMSPEITLWDLNVVNSLEPVAKLGEFSSMKKYQHRNYGHKDAVLDLSWNIRLPHVLASGSVDRSVLLWDLDSSKAVSHFTDFGDKVQTLEWHPSEVNILAAGACDSTVRMLDCRVVESVCLLTIKGEVEKVLWHPSSQFSLLIIVANSLCQSYRLLAFKGLTGTLEDVQFLVGTSKGELVCTDCRSGEVLWTVAAHDKELTGLVVSRDRVVSCSTDQTIKVWSLSQESPSLLHTQHTNHGELQCLQACPENSDIICVGGSSRDNNFRVYNISKEMKKRAQSLEMDDDVS